LYTSDAVSKLEFVNDATSVYYNRINEDCIIVAPTAAPTAAPTPPPTPGSTPGRYRYKRSNTISQKPSDVDFAYIFDGKGLFRAEERKKLTLNAVDKRKEAP